MIRRTTVVAVATAFFLLLIIVFTATNQLWVPDEPGKILPIYSGELWCVPDEYQAYVALEGVIGEASFPMIRSFYKGVDEKETVISIEKVLILEPLSGEKGKPYYLVDINSKPVSAVTGEYSEFKGVPHLWVFGHKFIYAGPDEETYTMLFPVEIHTSQVTDLVKQAKTVLVNEVGASYFQKYFRWPLLYKETFEDYTWKYYVSHSYTLKVGDYKTTEPVYVYFDEVRQPISTVGVPLKGNRMPFKVTREEAIRLAVEAGLPLEPEPFEADIIYAGNWGEENETLEFEGRYVWIVSVWIDEPEANPRYYMMAVIDPDTGKVYKTSRMGVASIGCIDHYDVTNPERALEHNILGYIEVCYVSKPPRLVIVSPGRDVNLTIQLRLVSHVPAFNETEVLLDPGQGSGFGVGNVIFNDYIVYTPSGSIILKLGEPVNVTMTLRVPEGFPGFSAKPQHLLGVGILADVPSVWEDGMQLNRIR